jgi:xylan 1,4-beta-xylosidase
MEGERYFEGTRSFVTASGIEKPLMNAYRAFAQLGDCRLRAVGTDLPAEVDALASRDADRVAILVWRHTDDQYAADSTTTRVDLVLEDLAPGCWTLQHFRIDRDHSNSHTIWRSLGCPQDPTADQLARIAARQGLERFADDTPIEVESSVELSLDLPLPALSLVVLTKLR